MKNTKLYKDVIAICKGYYEKNVYENELAALNAYYKLHFDCIHNELDTKTANTLFLYPTLQYIINCCPKETLELRYLFRSSSYEDEIMRTDATDPDMDFDTILCWRIIELIKVQQTKEYDSRKEGWNCYVNMNEYEKQNAI